MDVAMPPACITYICILGPEPVHSLRCNRDNGPLDIMTKALILNLVTVTQSPTPTPYQYKKNMNKEIFHKFDTDILNSQA